MVGTITPLVEEARNKEGRRGGASVVAAYVASSLVGAVLLFAVARGLRLGFDVSAPTAAAALEDAVLVIIGVLSLFVLLASTTQSLRLPMRNRQVPIMWRSRYGARRASVAYALVLGTGVATRINSPVVYLIPAVAFLAPHWQLALLVPATYALVKASAVVGASLALGEQNLHNRERAFAVISHQRLIWTGIEGIALAALFVVGGTSWFDGYWR